MQGKRCLSGILFSGFILSRDLNPLMSVVTCLQGCKVDSKEGYGAILGALLNHPHYIS